MDKFTLSNSRLLDLHQALESVKHLKGAKFGYAVSRTLRSIDHQIKALQDAKAFKKDYLEFRQAAEVIGKPLAVMQGDSPLYDVYNGELFLQIKPEKKSEFSKKFKSLKKKYSTAISANTAQHNEFKEILRQKDEIEVYSIPIDLIPEGITFGQAFRILPIILRDQGSDLVSCSYPNDLLIDFPSKVLHHFSGVTDRSFILNMLENFRTLDCFFLDYQNLKAVADYNTLYEEGRIGLCEKFASINAHGNPEMIDNNGQVEYVIDDSPLYQKAMKLFEGSMKDVTQVYEDFRSISTLEMFSSINFSQIPEDFSGTQIDLLADLIQE